jgi:predicted aspartyl protease
MTLSLALTFMFVVTLSMIGRPEASAASSLQTSAEQTGVEVFTSPDESSLVVESVKDGQSLSPLAEITGAGGLKWFMVKTATGNIGWIKAGDNNPAKTIDGHFRSLPIENSVIRPASPAESTSNAPPTGVSAIPVKVSGSKVIVSVNFNNRIAANLLLDTGASRTMISSRIAKILRLQSLGSGTGYGIGGVVTVSTARVESVKLGKMEMQNLPVMIHDFSRDPSYEGLLGFDFLSHFHMSLDLQKAVLVLTPRNR